MLTSGYFLGYPVNMNVPPPAFFDWRQQLLDAGINRIAYNNAGNPFQAAKIPFKTHAFEQEVIRRFGKLYAFPNDNIWGIVSNSGTDSNMHGLYMGRTLLKGRTGKLPKVYFTQETHYSIQILQDLLGLEAVLVQTLADGSMDAQDLRQKLVEHRDYPALVVATIGTTFKGAIDPVELIQQVLAGHPSYVHLDAALFGGYLPFTRYAETVAYPSLLNLGAARYDSIAVSCHKFFGFPSPAGLFITTQSQFDEFSTLFSRIHNPEYIHPVPGTISCSRDAVKPAEFYFFSTPAAMAKMTEDAQNILQLTDYLLDQLQNQFAHLQPKRANALSNTLYFRQPSERIVKKYSLATMPLTVDQTRQAYAHVVVMPHVQQKVLTEFLNDLGQDC